MSLSAASREQADLLTLGEPEPDAIDETASGEPFGHLLDLMLLAERGRLTLGPHSFEGAFAPSLLRFVTQERFLRMVESVIFRARPRYQEQTELLAMPRGRLRERSLLLSLASGIPQVESTFDELTTNTPLLRVIASALRVVATDRQPQKIAALCPDLQSRAVHLLRHLSMVTLIDRERALLEADRLWLGPLDRPWNPALDAALPVLRDRSILPEDDTAVTDGVMVHVSTEKFWEQCLVLALESLWASVAVSRDGRPGQGVSAPAPWVPRAVEGKSSPDLEASTFPDFMFRFSGQVVVADAKYKLGGSGATPSSQDGYQLFTYSHLAELDGHLSNLALVLYPTRPGGGPAQVESARLMDRSYPLWSLRLPFPIPADLHSPGSWGAYVSHLSATIREFSVEWATTST